MKQPIITKELQEILELHPEHKEVYFDATGRHWLQAHSLIAERDDEKESLYGQGQFSHKELIPGETNYDGLQYDINKGVPETKIVKTLSRKEVLDYKAKEEGTNIVSMVANMSPEDRAALSALLAPSAPAAPVTTPPAATPPKK